MKGVSAGTWILGGAGLAWALAAWLVTPECLASWMRHPTRADAIPASMRSAEWARWGWTVGGLALVLMPFALRSPRVTLRHPEAPRHLVLAMLAAVVLRFAFTGQGLWYDEIASSMTYAVHGPGAIVGNAFTTANHPLQSLLSWCCLPLGVEPWIRLPSVASGALTVLGCWWIGRAAAPASPLAAWCAGFAAIAPAAVNAGAEARGYGFMIACSAMASGLALDGLRAQGRQRWCAYALILALGVWAHFVTAMVGAGHAAVAIALCRRAESRAVATRWLVAIGFAALLALALWSPALPDLLASRGQFRAVRGDEPSLAGTQGWLLLWQLLGMTPLPNRGDGVDVPLALVTGLIPAAVIVTGLVAMLQGRDLRRGMAVAGLGLPMAVLLAWSGGSWLYARFLLFALPATVLLLAAGAQRLLPPEGRRRSTPGALVALLAVATCLAYDLAAPSRQPIREAVARVAAKRSPEDRVLGVGIADDVIQWYALAHDVPITPTGIGGERLPETLARTHARWIVALYPNHRHPNATTEAITRLGFRRRPVHGFTGWLDAGEGTVEVWERPADSP